MTALLAETQTHGPSDLAVTRACHALSLSRSTWYRWRAVPMPLDRDMALRDRIQRIALDRAAYGYRRITRQLQREGFAANHKRVLRIMREDNLLCLRRKSFIITTDSSHGLPVWPNLATDLTPDGPDQLWVADITYIRLCREFVYLAVILDAFSRRLIGWELDRRIDTALVRSALERALAGRNVRDGLIHHSDRGVQYAAADYIGRLMEQGIRISMSRRGNPYDNAYAESFMKTLKYEEVYLTEYQDIHDARTRIAQFLDDYNHNRLHSALGYRPPAEFEALQQPDGCIDRSALVLYNAFGTREGEEDRSVRSTSSFGMQRGAEASRDASPACSAPTADATLASAPTTTIG